MSPALMIFIFILTSDSFLFLTNTCLKKSTDEDQKVFKYCYEVIEINVLVGDSCTAVSKTVW